VTAAQRILERLQGVRRTGEGRWRARCPAHGSRAQSLAIADRDGRVLLYAHCGCSTDAVLGALGLELRDLYDTPREHSASPKSSPWSPRDVLDLVLAETAIVAVVATDAVERQTIAEADWRRLAQSASRLSTIARLVKP
jgi:hypothetical protein